MKNDDDERILEFIELSRLYDRYGGLLSEKSKKIVESYVVYDMSLGETAAETGSAVRVSGMFLSGRMKSSKRSMKYSGLSRVMTLSTMSSTR